MADMDIHTIGAGAVMESPDLQQVILPNGIKRLGGSSFAGCDRLMNAYVPYSVTSYATDAFAGCTKLTNLYVCGIELDEQKYFDLRSAARCVNGSTYITSYFPDNRRLKDAVASTVYKAANYIQNGITRLFTSQSLDDEKGAASIKRNLDGFSFDRDSQYMTETSEFLRLISDDSFKDVDVMSEEKNDHFLKLDKDPPIEKTAVFSFDDTSTKVEDGRYVIIASIKFGYHFWQSKVPVFLSGNTYYVYRRHYLSSEPDLNYIRRDVAVFTRSGPVSDRREALEVYAKYKLLSIL